MEPVRRAAVADFMQLAAIAEVLEDSDPSPQTVVRRARAMAYFHFWLVITG